MRPKLHFIVINNWKSAWVIPFFDIEISTLVTSIKPLSKQNKKSWTNTNIKEAKCRSCSINCGGSWCPIIICEFFTSAHANCALQFVGLETQRIKSETINSHIKLINNLIIFDAKHCCNTYIEASSFRTCKIFKLHTTCTNCNCNIVF